MANTYDVQPADIAAELPGPFPSGFSTTSVPTEAQVADMIAAADLVVTLAITDWVGAAPLASDRAASLAKRYIVESVKAQVFRVIYAGRDPLLVAQAASPYETSAKAMLTSLELMGSQIIGTGESSPRVLTSMGTSTLPTRDLIITDSDLDPNTSGRGRF